MSLNVVLFIDVCLRRSRRALPVTITAARINTVMSTYTGSLQPKKKQELQEIALALRISDSGTREELQSRIKTHLGLHEGTLAEDPRFGGLYGRTRKRSVQPQMPSSVSP